MIIQMRNFLILFLIFLFFQQSAAAYDLVLPAEKKNYVTSKYAFFVGKAKRSESITINDEHIYIAPNGAFAHSIKLKDGENRILIRSNLNKNIYKFYKTTPDRTDVNILNEFDNQIYTVNNDNTPMRSTPIDYGMNRISHLFKDTFLIINGSKGDFYRVYLSKNNYGWIKKTDVTPYTEPIQPVEFITLDSKTFKNASVHTIEFTEKIPYTIEEGDKEILFKAYNPFKDENSVYTVNIRKPEKYYYKTTLNNGVYQFKVNELPKTENYTLENITITIDPGHGGTELGAIGCLGDYEKDINLKIAGELSEILKLMGANVVMTRECDGNLSLQDRVDIAKEHCTNIFVSIHLNSIPDIKMNIHKNRGTSVYYYNKNSSELAKYIEKSVVRELGTRKDGVREASFAVIRPTDYVSVLVEVAYMTNPIDSTLYTSEDFPRKAAQAIANGILGYVNSEK